MTELNMDAPAKGTPKTQGETSNQTLQATPAHTRIAILRDFCMRIPGASCNRCVLACPVDAISFDDNEKPCIDEELCTQCGICLGICDTFSSTRITMEDLHERFSRIAKRGDDVIVTCKENIFPGLEPASNVVVLPCIACLSPEFWTLVLAENINVKLAADLSYCNDCTRAGDMGEMLYSHAIDTAEACTRKKVGYREDIPERDNLLKDMANPTGVDRRSAFTNLAGDVNDIATGKRRLRNSEVLGSFLERRERARAQARLNLSDGISFVDFVPEGRVRRTMWPKRKMMLEALKLDRDIAPKLSLTLSTTDETLCTNTCSCTLVCPTGARALDPTSHTLSFDNQYCTGCGLCEDACTNHAISLIETTAEVFLSENEEEATV